MADDAPSPARSADGSAPTAAEEHDATTAVATSPAEGVRTGGKSATRGDEEDVEMKSVDEAGEAIDEDEPQKKDENASASPIKKDGEDNDEENTDKPQEGGEEQEATTTATPAKKSHKKKGTTETKTPSRRKSVANLKEKDNGSTPAKAKKAEKPKEYKPEDLVLHKLKGYPPWPAVILSDEVAELKPDLMKARPGKSKAKAEDAVRGAYPVAYLHNLLEFSYAPISDLEPLTKDAMKSFVAKGRKKDLITAYEVAKAGVTMEEVREVFTQGPMAVDEDDEEDEEVEEEGEEEEEGAEQGGAEQEQPVKTSKKKGTKRKKTEDSEDEESDKPTKTPRRTSTIKTAKAKTPKSTTKTSKTPVKEKVVNGSSKPKTPTITIKTKISTKKATASTTKSKRGSKKAPASDDEEEEAAPAVESEVEDASPVPNPAAKKSHKKKAATPVVEKAGVEGPAEETVAPVKEEETPEQARSRRHKEILYIRHRLQKGFLTRDHVPSEDEMPALAGHLTSLESMEGMDGLDVGIIKETKINKVLKMITKLGTIPADETYHIRERAIALLEKVNALLAAEPEEEHPKEKEQPKEVEKEKPTNGAVTEDKDEEMRDAHVEERKGDGEESKSEVVVSDDKEVGGAKAEGEKDGDGDEKMGGDDA